MDAASQGQPKRERKQVLRNTGGSYGASNWRPIVTNAACRSAHAAGNQADRMCFDAYWNVCEIFAGTTISLARVRDSVTVFPLVIDCKIVCASARELTR